MCTIFLNNSRLHCCWYLETKKLIFCSRYKITESGYSSMDFLQNIGYSGNVLQNSLETIMFCSFWTNRLTECWNNNCLCLLFLSKDNYYLPWEFQGWSYAYLNERCAFCQLKNHHHQPITDIPMQFHTHTQTHNAENCQPLHYDYITKTHCNHTNNPFRSSVVITY